MHKFALAAALLLGLAGTAPAQDKPEAPLKLWRLDCGRLDENKDRPWAWQRVPTPLSCYLIAHGDRYMLWDTGASRRALGNAHPVVKLDRTLTDQLAEIGVKPEQIEFVGISHYHGDHTGQATQFPKAKLLFGAGDVEALRRPSPPPGTAPTHIQPWLDGQSPLEPLGEDRDVFGDGRVMILMAPGHTPGHSVLLVKLATGPVILAGDLWFTHADALTGRMPDFNTSRAETAASRDRIARIADKLDAVIIVQHEIDDIPKLPAFPEPAK